MKKDKKNEKYCSINGLRTIACIGIILMHILSNIDYELSNSVITNIIAQLSNFVLLFMTISAFGLCCGYYEKIKNNEMSPEAFYSKRIKKILPFFLFLSIVSLIIDHNITSLYETFANSTLLFGFINKDFSTIGVGWFIGLIFIFYIMFPFFTYLFRNKKSAWLTTIMALLMNITCILYFGIGKTNMFYSFIYFCIGGLIYLYKDTIIHFFDNKRIFAFILMLLAIILFFTLPANSYLFLLKSILLIIMLIVYSISFDSKVLNNRITRFISNISFEIYLCHMVIFRIAERLNMTKLFSNNYISYIFLSLVIICGAIVLSYLFKVLFEKITRKLAK